MPVPFTLALMATAVAWLPPMLFGVRWHDYRAVRDFISELGAAGAPDASVVNVSFAIAGALFVAACAAVGRARPAWRVGLALVSAAGWSYLVAAIVPCDAGCPAQGSSQQALHNTVGAAGYVLAGIGLLLLAGRMSRDGRPALASLARAAGVVGIGGLAAMGAPELEAVRGALQRIVELGLFASLLAIAQATNVSSSPRPTSGPA